MILTPEELVRLQIAARVAMSIPFVDDIEDYVWECIWAYGKGLPTPPRDRNKRLFDVVDPLNAIGWSAKTLKWSLAAPTCEFVIQRADVFDKRDLLGFPDLSIDSPPQEIGNAVIKHWTNKIYGDMEIQGVEHTRLALLLKDAPRTTLIPLEEDLFVPSAEEISWAWSNSNRRGLLGHRNGTLVYRWYSNQKQLFEIVNLPDSAPSLTVPNSPWSVAEVIERLRE